jgi:hypothetical protein
LKAGLIATKQFDAKIQEPAKRRRIGRTRIRLGVCTGIPGKRGGIRVIYYYSAHHGVALMMAAYAKNVQENLTNDQKRKIRSVATQFQESLGA